MRILILLLAGAVIGFYLHHLWVSFFKIRKDDLKMHTGNYILSISLNPDETYHVNIVEKSLLKEKSILELDVRKDALFDVVMSAKNKGYIDEDGENLVLAKYSV